MKYGIVLLFSVVGIRTELDFQPREQSVRIRTRYLHLMRMRYEEASKRISDCNEMKWMYEESPHYESGYVVGEIVERYRKLVEIVKWQREYVGETFFHSLYRVEMCQRLYFEVYHLAQMLHEIPKKYEHMAEFMFLDKQVDYNKLMEIEKERTYLQKRRERERKKQQKIRKKMLQAFHRGKNWEAGSRPPRNRFFPIDYGWEINAEDWLPEWKLPVA